MTSYLHDAKANNVIRITPQNPQLHLKSYKVSPPCLRFSLSSMTKTSKNTKGRGEPMAPKEEGRAGENGTPTFFLKKKSK